MRKISFCTAIAVFVFISSSTLFATTTNIVDETIGPLGITNGQGVVIGGRGRGQRQNLEEEPGVTAGQSTNTNSSGYAVVGKGPNHRVWEKTHFKTNELGGVTTITNSFIQLETGLHYQNGQQWVETDADIQINALGAAAEHGRHKVEFHPNVNTAGAIQITTPDNKVLTTHVAFLAYYDYKSRQSVLIAETKDSNGAKVSKNSVLYRDAFTDFRADIRYTYTKAGIEQDVILRQRPPLPSDFGLNPASTRLEIWTEFIDPPEPKREQQVRKRWLKAKVDRVLDFGDMKIVPGRAFISHGGSKSGSLAVEKQWLKVDGRTFLVEDVSYRWLIPHLRELPPGPQAKAGDIPGSIRHVVSNERLLPPVKVANKSSNEKFAMAEAPQEKGLVLDYMLLLTETNVTLKAGTYYVSGEVDFSGVTTIEPGAIFKYTNGAQINVWGAIRCSGDFTRPIIFTSKDDNTQGQTITGSTGTPTGTYAATALMLGGGGTMENVRISYASTAIDTSNYEFYLRHSQILNCGVGLQINEHNFIFENVLLNNVSNAFYGRFYQGTVEHLTYNGGDILTDDWDYYSGEGCDAVASSSVTAVNSIFCNVTNWGIVSFNSDHCETFADTSSFSAVGAGSHYLPTNSVAKQAGRTPLSSELAGELKFLTTDAPVILTNIVTTDTILSPRAHRDTNSAPNLGYHYYPIDFMVNSYRITNSTLTLTNGVMIAPFDGTGIWLQSGSHLVSEGTPLSRNKFVSYYNIQEQPVILGPGTAHTAQKINTYNTGSPPSVTLKFTDFESNGGMTPEIDLYGDDVHWTHEFLKITDCEFRRATIYYNGGLPGHSIVAKNNLFEDCYFECMPFDGGLVDMRNNLFEGGVLYLSSATNASVFTDNILNQCNFSSEWGGTHGHNAYIGVTNSITPVSLGNDVVLTNFIFETGLLGKYYQSSADLIDQGSQNATNAGLYHYTTRYGQDKETNSISDIGYHYVAANPPVETVWIEDELPENSVEGNNSAEEWNWISSDPTPYSGSLAHQSEDQGGFHWHYFEDATPLTIGRHDKLFCYIYLNSISLPAEVMLQWMSTDTSLWSVSLRHRAFWGEDMIYTGARTYMGPLPTTNAWVRLEAPASLVGLRDSQVDGIGFTLGDGSATWDYSGKVSFDGNLADSDADGLANYFEDRDGDGIRDGAESDWMDPDTDDDGLDDYEEYLQRTNPTNSDTDGDGMPDGWEVLYGLDPLVNDASLDADADDLTNLEEYELGTDPTVEDTDLDGIPDGEEVDYHGTDPTKWDTDDDGISDSDEMVLSTDPLNPDHDSDGLKDGEEVLIYGTDPTQADTDQDGLSDFDEMFIHETDPLIPDTDKDGVSDGDEIALSIDPLNSDTDNDRMLDGWEVTFALNPSDPSDAGSDPDSDDLTNLHEHDLGLNPQILDTDGDGAVDSTDPDLVWVEDAIPGGATASETNDSWTWITNNVFSGTSAHVSDGIAEFHTHYFEGATNKLIVRPGDLLITHVYLDSGDLPSEIMLQWKDDFDGWEHRAYWGADVIDLGTNETSSRAYMGPIPSNGQWVRLEVPAALVDLENRYVNGMAFTLYDGTATWDYSGKVIGDTDLDGLPDWWESQYFETNLGQNAEDDSDGDGLTNLQEYQIGSSPTLSDTDGDGMPDAWEYQYGLNPLDDADATTDLDEDGLTNHEEFLAGTDPTDPDTDQDGLGDADEILIFETDPTNGDSDLDGLSDYDEVVTFGTDPNSDDTDGDQLTDFEEIRTYSTNPLKHDTDEDHLSDYEEINVSLTNPLNRDSDSDGMSDGWEVLYGLDPALSVDADEDPDEDGLDNLREYQIGTNPRKADTDDDGTYDPSDPELTWVEDSVPGGATEGSVNENWNWISNNPSPFSGTLAHQSAFVSGLHKHYFTTATNKMAIVPGDRLITHVYLAETNRPAEIILEWHESITGWEHRAYWGTNAIELGTNGTASRHYMGDVPTNIGWVRLDVPAESVGLEYRIVDGMSFVLYDGMASWDSSGKEIADIDADGMWDWWERQYFGDLNHEDPNADSDGDGRTDVQEMLEGTDPTDGNSAEAVRLAHWTFDSRLVNSWTGDSNVVDSVSEDHGFFENEPVYEPGVTGDAFSFDGNEKPINFGNRAGNFGTNDFTIDFWLKTESTRPEILMAKRSPDAGGTYWQIWNRVDGRISLEVSQQGTGDSVVIVTSSTSCNDGAFHKVTINRYQTNLYLYIDGKREASKNTAEIIDFETTDDFLIGTGARPEVRLCEGSEDTEPFDGLLDEIKLYQSALWFGEGGQAPLSYTNICAVPGWSSDSVLINSTNATFLRYPEKDTAVNFLCQKGTLRFWLKPLWDSQSTNGPSGPGEEARLTELGAQGDPEGWWGLVLNTNGTQISFVTETNGVTVTNLSTEINWGSNEWHQIVLTYTDTNSVLYLDGQAVTNGVGVTAYPSATARSTSGLCVGSSPTGANQARGQFEEMETFNAPLSAAQILQNYSAVTANDADLDGVPDDQDLAPNNPNVGGVIITIDNPEDGSTIY